jgi:hypothetical protein
MFTANFGFLVQNVRSAFIIACGEGNVKAKGRGDELKNAVK